MLIESQIKDILSKPNAYAIVLGDLCNNAVKSSVSDIYGEILTPMQQMKTVVELLRPLVDANRILAVVPGNHEFRTYKDDGLSMMEIICNELGISKLYRPATAYIFVRMGHSYDHLKRPNTYGIYVNHGNSGGRTVGGKANGLSRQMEVADADLYICGHTHLPLTFKENFYRPTFGAAAVEEVTHAFINTNAMLGYGGYGERKGYKPACTDVPRAYLHSGKKYITVTI